MLHPKATEIYFTLHNGVQMPALGLGTANIGERAPETKQAVKAAIKAGYRHIDTAWYYGTESYIGEALTELFENGDVKRSDLFITTKVWPVFWNDPSESLNRSLKALNLDYVDLFLQHWPLCFDQKEDLKNGRDGLAGIPKDDNGNLLATKGADYFTTYRKLEQIYLDPNDTRVRAIGVSNYPEEYMEKLLKECSVKPTINQVELHPHLPQLELKQYCEKNDIIMTAYSPMGSHGGPLVKLPLVKELADKYGVTPNEVLTSYHIRRGTVVIPRSLNPARIASSIGFVPLTEAELHSLDKIGIENPERFIDESFTVGIPGFTGTK